MNDFERGFIVGLIEGEGTITLMLQTGKQKYNKDGQTEYYAFSTIFPKILIANTNKKLIVRASEILGGKIYKSDRKGRKPIFHLEVHGIQRVLQVLDELKHDFIGKRRQAALVWEFCKLRLTRKGNKMTSKKTAYGEREFEILKEVRHLNVLKGGRSKKGESVIEGRVALIKRGYLRFQSEKCALRREKRICKWCGKEFTILQSKSKAKGRGTCCSKHCMGKLWRARQLGLSLLEAKARWSTLG